MRIMVAPDSFKGTLTAVEAARIICETGRKVHEDWDFVPLPVGDGGEGTMESLIAACHGRKETVFVEGPLGGKVEAHLGILNQQRVILEMAEASGLCLLKPDQYQPLNTSTFGTGQLLRYAIQKEWKQVLMCIGGSATNDGGMGALQALGMRFLDQNDRELKGCGANLIKIKRIDTRDFIFNQKKIQLTILCDVLNPFTGRKGATYVYGPQKGATNFMLESLEEGMLHFQNLAAQYLGKDLLTLPGTGAAGGLGGALMAFCKGQLMPGIDTVLDQIEFDRYLSEADAVITGEGKVDSQTLNGKVVYGVLKRCHPQKIPLYVLGGIIDEGAEDLYKEGVAWMESCSENPFTEESSMQKPKEALEEATKRLLSKIEN